MKKHILFFAHYFYPDVASTGQLLTEVCESLVDEFEITVICAVPSYTGKIDDKYKNSRFFYDKYKEINIIRVSVPEFKKTNKFSRVKNISCYFINSLLALRKLNNIDVIFTISQPPVLGGLLGMLGKKIKKCKFIYNIQDFNPEQIEAVNYSSSSFIIKIMKLIDNITIKSADKILLVGRDQQETLKNRNKEFIKKSLVINNWTDDEKIYPLTKENDLVINLKKQYNLENKFIIMYSGNLGLYYDLENIIKLSQKFKDNEDIAFVFAGDGAVKESLELYKKNNNSQNIYILPYQPKENLNISLNMADVHFVINAKGIKGVSVPSKLYGVMAAGKTVLGVLEEGSEARMIIEESNCGLCTEPGNYDEIEKIIRSFYIDKDKLEKFENNARQYLEKNLCKQISLEKYKLLINEV